MSNAILSSKIVTIIVNYNIADHVIDAVRSLEPSAQKFDDFTVRIVDNQSTGNDVELLSAAILENGWQDWVKLHPENDNLGFAAGNNVALREALTHAPADFIYLLNPDAWVRDDAVEQLVSFLEQNSEVGIVGSRCEYEEGSVQVSAFRFPTILGEFEQAISLSFVTRLLARRQIAPRPKNTTYQTDWLSGASVMIRKQVFDDIGMMDQGYFLYYEETDFMLQAARAGWSAWYLHTARAVHLVSQSTKIQNESSIDEAPRQNKPLPAYWFDSWRYYFTKNHGRVYAITAGMAWMAGSLLYKAHRFILRRPSTQPAHATSSFWKHCFVPLLRESTKTLGDKDVRT